MPVLGGAVAQRPLPLPVSVDHGTYRCSSGHALALAFAVVLLSFADAAGASLNSGVATASACLVLLLTGLPHGALDIEILKRGRGDGARSTGTLLAAYLGLAGAMLLVWLAAPVLALLAFLLTAVVHFAEDWDEADEPFLARGTAAALLCAPALTHHAELAAVFTGLCGDPRAALVADGMLMLAPVTVSIAAVTAIRLITLDRTAQGMATLAVLAAMTVLPPVIGFALYFCAHHSPRHLQQAWRAVALTKLPARRLLWTIVSITTAALGMAAALFALEVRVEFAARTVAAAFMTLSVLTVPHMALPAIMVRLRVIRT